MRIHIPRVLFAVDPCRGVAAFKQVVVDLADAARAGLADLAHVRLKINDGRRIRLRRWLVQEFCLADSAVDLPRGGVLHIRGRVRVNVQRRGRRHMSQHGGERFYVHPILQRQGRECVPLRYNNDKQKKPLFSRGLSVCRLLFNSFSKLKIDENYKEKRRLFY